MITPYTIVCQITGSAKVTRLSDMIDAFSTEEPSKHVVSLRKETAKASTPSPVVISGFRLIMYSLWSVA